MTNELVSMGVTLVCWFMEGFNMDINSKIDSAINQFYTDSYIHPSIIVIHVKNWKNISNHNSIGLTKKFRDIEIITTEDIEKNEVRVY